PQHFFSYTETDKEVSLILDETHIMGFPEEALNVCNVVWRALQIEPGESGLGAVEVVTQISKPLADINVSIMQISTYDADFTILPECDLIRALDCIATKFSISNSPFEEAGLQPSDLQSWEESFPINNMRSNSSNSNSTGINNNDHDNDSLSSSPATRSPTEINSLRDALLLGAATTIGYGRRRRRSSYDGYNSGETENSRSSSSHNHHQHHSNQSNGREDSGIGSEATSGPSSGLTSGNGSHVLGADTIQKGLDLDLGAISLQESLERDPSVTWTRTQQQLFKADFPYRLHITSMEHGLMDQHAIRLLESIFFDNRDDRFFSFTQTDSTLSIIMDDATMSLFPDHTLNTQAGDWRLISIGDGPLSLGPAPVSSPLGLVHDSQNDNDSSEIRSSCTGTVSDFSRPLGEDGIGMFYLSTFSENYLMVNEQDFDRAVECLEEIAKRTASTLASATEASSISPMSPLSMTQEDGQERRGVCDTRRRSGETKSIRSIDTMSVSASSDVEDAELSPVSTAADLSDAKDEEDALARIWS
ncbi:GATS protein-like 3, partial [Dissophora globulifera]